MHKTRRPTHCAPGSITDARELGERLRVSRERLAGSELANIGQAWRLWAACAEATFGYAREADRIYLSTLAKAANVHRTKAGPILRRFDELDVFTWSAARRGSHGISELGLPHVAPRLHEGAHVAPRLHDEPSSCSPHGSLQSNDLDSHNSKQETPQRTSWEAETGTSLSGTPEEVRPRLELKSLSVEELQLGVDEYAPTIAGLYAAELERRNVAPVRRPAWLDYHEGDA